MEREIWKDIPGYEGLYQASNLGNIKRDGHILKGCNNGQGYMVLNLWKGGVGKSYKIHRLVATTFIDNSKTKRTVNHKNGIKADNRVVNLEWNTHSENHIHRFRALGHTSPFLGKKGGLNHNAKKVGQYSKNGDFIKEWGSQQEVARHFGMSQGNLWSALNGKQNTYAGYKWRYI